MDYSIMEMYKFIPENSKVLDCGCGWGGPARLLIKDLNCDVTGVTVSEQQANYIKDFKVIHSDLHDLELTEQYDVALFVESYSHLHDPVSVLKNLSFFVDKIIIRDYINLQGNFVKYDSKWKMTIGDKSKYTHDLNRAGFTVKNFEIRPHSYQPEAGLWLNNILQLDEKDITGQIKLLYEYCNKCLQSATESGQSSNGICTIYAEVDK